MRDTVRTPYPVFARQHPRDALLCKRTDAGLHLPWRSLAAEAQAEFWKELRLDIAKKGLWGLIITIGTLIVIGLSTKLGFSHTLPH